MAELKAEVERLLGAEKLKKERSTSRRITERWEGRKE